MLQCPVVSACPVQSSVPSPSGNGCTWAENRNRTVESLHQRHATWKIALQQKEQFDWLPLTCCLCGTLTPGSECCPSLPRSPSSACPAHQSLQHETGKRPGTLWLKQLGLKYNSYCSQIVTVNMGIECSTLCLGVEHPLTGLGTDLCPCNPRGRYPK